MCVWGGVIHDSTGHESTGGSGAKKLDVDNNPKTKNKEQISGVTF